MRERNGINNLSAELRSGFHRIMAGVKVTGITMIDGTESKHPEFDIQPSFFKTDYEIKIGRTRKLDYLEASGAAVDVRFESDPVCLDVIAASDVKSGEIDCKFKIQEPWQVNTGFPEGIAESAIGLKITANKAVSAFPNPIHIERPWKLKLFKGMVVRRDPDRMLDIPMVVKACDWSSLDRGFILKCWETLKKKTIAGIGRDPGKKLEMMGIYRNINLSLVRKSEFNHAGRELKLYFNKDWTTCKNEQGNCVIIIGLDKGTGAIIQAVIRNT
ncbi:MAG: hypothetical protein NTY09_10280 [bacterium]|nr:hypothetical protein [bacterium]